MAKFSFDAASASKIPMMDAGAKAWMYKYAKKNYWRVAAWMEFDDLIQDGYYAWCEVCRRYPTAVNNPAHIMSLFKLCFADKITDLARVRTKQQDDARSDIVDLYDGADADYSSFQDLLIKAPKAIKDALSLLANDNMRKALQEPLQRQEDGRRETLNERFCSLLNLDPGKIDIVSDLRSYFA